MTKTATIWLSDQKKYVGCIIKNLRTKDKHHRNLGWVGKEKSLILATIYLFKVNNRHTIKRCKICSKLIINTRTTSLTLLLTLNNEC